MKETLDQEARIKEIEEKIKEWVNASPNTIREIQPCVIYTPEDFKEIAEVFVRSQLKKIGGFEGATGETENISYGLIKLKKVHPVGWPLEVGMILIFEPCTKTANGQVRALGFGINPFTKQLVGISFHDNTPLVVEIQLKGNGGFYFGSTEYPLDEYDMGGNESYNHFVIPVGNEYQKYFSIVQKIWINYLTKVNSV